jgi:transcriptional regulator with XRE-family HTH domain
MGMKERVRVEVDWKKLCEEREKSGLSQMKLSMAVGQSASWFSLAKKDKAKVRVVVLEKLAEVLKIDYRELVKEEELKVVDELLGKKTSSETAEGETKADEPQELFDEMMTDFERDMYTAFAELKAELFESRQELKSCKEILMYLFNEKQQAENKSKAEREKDELQTACHLLKTLLSNRNSMKHADWLAEAAKEGVSIDMADAAVAKVGFKKKTMGYGSNKVKWVYKPVEGVDQ